MTDGVSGAIIGKWRIIEADLWDRAYLDLVGMDQTGEVSTRIEHLESKSALNTVTKLL